MEFVDGESLQQRLDRDGKLRSGEAADLCRQAALGLRAANQHGFIHRDVKPSNLLVDKSGLVKIADFGLVKDATPGRVAETEAGAGAIVGTPLYMAPEQARGESVDYRADIYSLGATLHHLVAGEPPFTGASPLAVVSKHSSSPRPTITGGDRSVPMVDGLCERMMAKRPDARFPSYDALITALERVSPRVTRPAGFWVRAFAALLDLVLIAVFSTALDGLLGRFAHLDLELLPTLAAAYLIIGHARFGKTLGKLALEVEVVPDDGAPRLGWKRAGLRWLAEWGPIYLLIWLMEMRDVMGLSGGWDVVVVVACAAVGLAILGAAALTAGRRTYWDRAAGTRTMYRRAG
jgi:hypothetical protein